METIYSELEEFCPNLCIGQRRGPTDYIDFICEEDMSDIPKGIAIGVDIFQRPFISVRVLDTNNGEKSVHTFFRRYTRDSEIWCIGTRYKRIFEVLIKDSTIKLIKDLLNGSKLESNGTTYILDTC